MSLLEQIKKQQLDARKQGDKDRAALLTTLIGEASRPGLDNGKRESTDDEVIAVIKKFIKNIDECLAKVTDSVKITDFNTEKSILTSFLPQQVTGDSLKDVILSIIEETGKNEKSIIMRELKTRLAGQYDGREASTIVDGLK